MVNITFKTSIQDNMFILAFDIDGGVCTPTDLKHINPPKAPPGHGVVITGRGPIWLYVALAHHYHPALWVATYDPRLMGAVVSQTHTPLVKLGDIVSVSLQVD